MNFGPGKLYLNGKLRGEVSELTVEVADKPVGASKLRNIIAAPTGLRALTVEYRRANAINEAFRRLSRTAEAAALATDQLARFTDRLARAWHEPDHKKAQWKQRHYGPQRR